MIPTDREFVRQIFKRYLEYAERIKDILERMQVSDTETEEVYPPGYRRKLEEISKYLITPSKCTLDDAFLPNDVLHKLHQNVILPIKSLTDAPNILLAGVLTTIIIRFNF